MFGKIIDVLRIVFGILCVLSGLVKPFPQVEDIPATLRNIASANVGSFLEYPSRVIADNPMVIIPFLMVCLIGSGLAFVINRLLVPAALCQLAMFSCFVIFIFRMDQNIILIDLPFLLVALAVLIKARKAKLKEFL